MIYQTLLVTGCGGDIGIALARIVRDTRCAARIIGCDIHDDHPGHVYFDLCDLMPRATDPDWETALRAMIAKHAPDAIVPMSEAEILKLHILGTLESFDGIPVITANAYAIETGLDKFVTYQRLSAAGLGVALTVPVTNDTNPPSLPCVFKPQSGQGSKGFRVVRTQDEVATLTSTYAGQGYIWQELLLPDDAEYTCGLYRDAKDHVRIIVLRRQLQGGLTSKAVVVDAAPFAPLLDGIAQALDLRGAINVQLRMTDDGPKVFEINPRFSSTVMFRQKLGFRDLVWSLMERQGLAIEDYAPPATGTRIYRTATETIINP